MADNSLDLVSLFEHADDAEYYMEGSSLFEQGQPGDVMYVVLEGRVEIQVQQAF